jgi:hypothetical protein
MPIKIKAGMVGGFGTRDFAKFVIDDAGIATRAGVEAGAEGLRDELRDQIANAGLGERLGRAVGAKVYPPSGKGSLDAAGFVYPRGRKAAAIFDSWNQGATITAHGGKYLAIPTKEAGRGWRNTKAKPQEFEQRTGIKLRFVKLKNGNAVLVGDAIAAKSGRGRRAATKGRRAQGRTVQSLVFFILIRSAKIPKRLDFDAIARKWADRIPGLIDAASRGSV